jgi:hypothetical protein
MRIRIAVFVCVAIVVGLYDRWAVQAAGVGFHWGESQDGYYVMLARAFAAGHLYLPFDPDPKLLAQPDPYDPDVDNSLKLWDAALYNKRYYLYHGAGPAILLFLPWRLVTGRDLPQNFASLLQCFGGFLFSGAALLGWLRLAGKEPGPVMTAILLLGLGFCTNIPFLLSRSEMYEIAIGGAYCCSSAGIWFLVRGLEEKKHGWMAAAGAAFGLAIACRPHLGLLALAAAAIVMVRLRRSAVWFLVPIVVAAAAIGVYNFERFGNPAEFGIRYMLTGKYMNSLHANPSNIIPATFYFAAAPPEVSRIFPWIRLPWDHLIVLPKPERFILEPTVGVLWLAPFLPAFLLVPLLRRAALPLGLFAVAGLGVFMFLAVTGMCTQRYIVDFLPVLAMSALAGAANWKHPVWVGALAVLVLFGTVINLALGIIGHDGMIQKRPDRYVRLARMFTPRWANRLVLNPAFELVCPAGAPFRFSAGPPRFLYEIKTEGNRIVSRRADSIMISGASAGEYRVAYEPSAQEIVVSTKEVELLRHKVGQLVVSSSDFDEAVSAGCKRLR